MDSVRHLLQHIVDYAGLFPPASIGMIGAVRNYETYRAGEHAWMLGKFIVAVSQLSEFEAVVSGSVPRGIDTSPWRISALAGADLKADVEKILDFNERHAKRGQVLVDGIELRAASPGGVEKSRRWIPENLEAHFEISRGGEAAALIKAVRVARGRAKVRTGGTRPDEIPAGTDLIRFMETCRAAGVPFKATAGLHHAVRSVYPLTYETGGPSAKTHGFLNVFLAAAFLSSGMKADTALELLEEESAGTFRFDDGGVSWRSHRLGNAALLDVRNEFALSFGSCSFEEPIDDLERLKLL